MKSRSSFLAAVPLFKAAIPTAVTSGTSARYMYDRQDDFLSKARRTIILPQLRVYRVMVLKIGIKLTVQVLVPCVAFHELKDVK